MSFSVPFNWRDDRERELGLALGFVIRPARLPSLASPCQIQKLELGKGGEVRVGMVAPGDYWHLMLWEGLRKKESEWETASHLVPLEREDYRGE